MSRNPSLRRRVRTSALAGVAVAALVVTINPGGAGAAPADSTETGAKNTMNSAFAKAAEKYEVPRDLLVTVGYGESRLNGHDGKPSQANGYGVMHLVSNPDQHTLERAADITGKSERALKRDTAANIHGGAAVLSDLADKAGLEESERKDLDAWYEVVARYSGAQNDSTARLYADTVYRNLSEGVKALTPAGEQVSVSAKDVSPERGRYAKVRSLDAPAKDVGAQSPDYPDAQWVPADASNYGAGRSSAITHIVMHVTQGSYAGSISWFQNPDANVSAHYVIRSSDGEVTQMVRDGDTAWHARSGNPYSLGIEHEGFVDDPAWFTDAMYRSSAALTNHLANAHGIPKDREHIVGHNEVPGNDHTDPGPNWDWDYFMELVGGGAEAPPTLSFPSYDTLKEGAEGSQVKAAQHLLNKGGFEAGAVDGIFGPTTAGAVSDFQSDKGIEANGVVNAGTWTALLSTGTTPVVKEGSQGAAVERLQRALTAALDRTVEADGIFGPATAKAVRDYQTSRDLVVDGIVGEGTWGALQSGR